MTSWESAGGRKVAEGSPAPLASSHIAPSQPPSSPHLAVNGDRETALCLKDDEPDTQKGFVCACVHACVRVDACVCVQMCAHRHASMCVRVCPDEFPF